MNKLVTKKIINAIYTGQAKIITGGIFLFVVLLFSLFLLRKDKYVFITLYLTEREEAKYWMNYPDKFYYNQLKVGTTEKNELGLPIAEIVDVLRTGTSYTHEQGLITLKLKANYNSVTQVYSFRGQPLTLGEYERIKVGPLLVQGYLIDLSTEKFGYKEKVYRVQAMIDDPSESARGSNDTKVVGAPKEIVEALQQNESVINSHGNVSTRLISLTYQPAIRVSYSSAGKKLFQDPDLYEGEAELELRTIEIDGTDYWDFVVPIQIGQRLTINFKKTQLPVKITDIISVKDVTNEEARN